MIDFLMWVPLGRDTAPVWGWLLAAFTTLLPFWWLTGYELYCWWTGT